MKKSYIVVVGMIGVGLFCIQSSFADYDYPELAVTPLASKRLESEVRTERRNQLVSFAPFQISGVGTILSGIAKSSDENRSNETTEKENDAMLTGLAVGGGWLLVSTALMFQYSPYAVSYVQVKGMPAGTKREQLERERAAEEGLDRPARLAKRLMWLSVASEALANGYIISKTGLGALQITGLVLSFTPLVFQSPWISTAKSQEEYKKKIYGPVASISPQIWTVRDERLAYRLAPGFAASFRF